MNKQSNNIYFKETMDACLLKRDCAIKSLHGILNRTGRNFYRIALGQQKAPAGDHDIPFWIGYHIGYRIGF